MKIRTTGFAVLVTILVLAAGCSDNDGPDEDILGGDTGGDQIEPADVADDTGTDLATPDVLPDVVITDEGGDTAADVTTDYDADAVEPGDAVTDEGTDETEPDALMDVADDGLDAQDAGDVFVPEDTGTDAGLDVTSDAGLDVTSDAGLDIVPEDTAAGDIGTEVDDDTYNPPEPTGISGVMPESAIENTEFLLTIAGTGFTGGMSLSITGDNALTAGYTATPATMSILDGGNKILALFASSNGLIRGYYRVEVADGTGVVLDSLSGFRILPATALAPTVTNVTPDTAKTGRDRMVAITGTGFASGASVVVTGYGETYECSYVEVADSGSLTAVVQAGTSQIPVGEYEVWVINPDGLGGKWDSMFTISDLAPPSITAISPIRAGNASDVTMTVTGIDFQEGALVSLTGTTEDIPLATTEVTAGTVLTAVIPSGLAAGIYPVKVTNPDFQFDVFYFYQVSNNSPGSLTTFEQMTETLNIPRWQHGLDAMVDGMGHGFLVVTGGLDAGDVPIDDVEISQISPNGTPGVWNLPIQTDPVTGLRIVNRMSEPRSGAASVRVGRTLFVAGGRSLPEASSQALDTIEMTRMLNGSGAPKLRAPTVAVGGGFLPEGRWLYRVSAVTPAGETLASSSVSYRGDAGALTMSWEPVSGALGYNIYRCPSANCTYGQEVAVSWMLAGTTRSFVDQGSGVLTPSPSDIGLMPYPDDPGALDQPTYSYVVTSVTEIDESTVFESVPGAAHMVVVPGGSGVVSLVWNDVAAADSYRIYRAAGTGDHVLIGETLAGTLSFDDDLSPAVLADTPPMGVQPLPTGSLSLFEYMKGADDQPILLNIPREGARATFVETQYDETDPAALTGVMFIIGGRTGFEPLPGAETTAESIKFFIDGSLIGPEIQDVGLLTGRAFFGLGNSQNRLDNLTFEDDDDDDPVTPDCPDADNDGFFDKACGGTDCDDTNLMINPAANEDLQNGVDDNCDGLVDVPTQGWESPSGGSGIPTGMPVKRALDENPEPVFLIAMLGNDDVLATGDTGLSDIEAVGVDLFTGDLLELNAVPESLWTHQTNADNSVVHGSNVALYQKYLFSFMGVASENLGQVPTSLIAQSKRFPYCPPPLPDDPGDASFGCPGYTDWTYSDLAGVKRTSANATVSGGLGYYGLTRAFGYIYLVAGVDSSGVSDDTWRVLQ